MRKVTVETFQAFDGSNHETENNCHEYEERQLFDHAVEDSEFANMIEALGMKLRKARQERGDLRRASPKKKVAPPIQKKAAE